MAISIAAGQARAAAEASAGSAELEQIVVTAQKSEAKLQSTPLSISTVDQSLLDRANITDFVQMDGVVPGVVINATGIRAPTITIRGVGDEGWQFESAQPGVSFSQDGVYIAAPVGIEASFLDVRQIEVLRGPQGTVLGENADGGAINVTTVQPRLGVFSGDAEASYGSYDFIRGRFDINVPIGGAVALRAAVQQESHDGWAVATQIPGQPNYPLDNENSIDARLTLLWKPTDRLSVTIWGEHYSNNTHPSGAKNILDPNPDPRQVTEDYAGYSKLDTNTIAGTIAYNLGFATLKSISSYQYNIYSNPQDIDKLDYALADTLYGGHYITNDYHTYPSAVTSELDLISAQNSKFTWIVGGFLLAQYNTLGSTQYQTLSPGPMPVNYNPTTSQLYAIYDDGLAFETTAQQNHASYAMYGQASYQITPQLTLTGGARYTWDNSSGEVSTYYSPYTYLHTSFQSLTGKVSLAYEYERDRLVYATYSTGVKPGGTDLNPGAELVPTTFQHETVQEIEVGSKNQFFDRRVRFNIDGFYNNYRNMQVESDDPLPYVGGLTNLGRVITYGVEAEGSAILPYHFRLDANAASLGGKVESHAPLLLDPIVTNALDVIYGTYTPADLVARAGAEEDVYGKTPPKLPKFSTFLALSREDAMPFGGTLESRIQAIYRTSYFFRVFDNPLYDKVPSMYQLNMSFRYTPDHEPWYLEMVIVNLTNNNAVNARVADGFGVGEVANIYVPPLQVIGRVGVSF